MRLYSYWRSSSAWRVRIVLAYKRLDYTLVPVHLRRDEQHLPDFVERSPLGQVPVLELDAETGPVSLTQSMAILEYLEEVHPHPPLLPADPLARARVRALAETINAGTQPLQNLALQRELQARGVDPAPLVAGFIQKGLRALEALGGTSAGRFLVGDSPTFADVYLVPQLYAARRFGVDVAAFPLLSRVEEACTALPAFATAHPDRQPDCEPATA